MIPETLADITGSPFGALIGIHSTIWKQYCIQNEEIRSDDAYVLFIEEDSNICINKLCDLPDATHLEDFLYLFRDMFKYPEDDCKVKRQCKRLFDNCGINREITNEDLLIYTQLKIDLEFFYKIFCTHLRKITEFINFEQDVQTYMEKKQGAKIFDTDNFIDSIPADHQEFIKGMVHTQMFSSFIDKSYKLHNNLLGDEKDTEKIEYFYNCINAYQSHSSK